MEYNPVIVNNLNVTIYPYSIGSHISADMPEGQQVCTAYNLKATISEEGDTLKQALIQALNLTNIITPEQILKINITLNADLQI